MNNAQLGLYLLAWTAYLLLHSLLASLACKRWVARHWKGGVAPYRLFYNLLALVLLLPLLYWGGAMRGELLLEWRGGWSWLADLLFTVAIAGFLYSLRGYDSMEFLGLRQWRSGEQRVEDQGQLCISPLHRYVRHPWYALALVMIWSRDMDLTQLSTTLLITLYLILGSRLEERRLVVYYGEAYRRYQQRVPGLLPLPWRRLSGAEAAELVARSRHA